MTFPSSAVCAVAVLMGCAFEPAPATDELARGVERAANDGDTSPCPVGALCLYENPDRRGVMVVLSAGTSLRDLRTIPCPGCITGSIGQERTFDKQMSSWENRTAIASCFYEKPVYEGPQHVMGIDEFQNAGPGVDNVASSVGPCRRPVVR